MLQLSHVTKRFGHFTANDDVTLQVDAGEVVGLLGANGAGKTTAIRQGLGLLTPSAGKVRHFGSVPSRATRTRIGYVPQSLGLWSDLTVRENLRFSAAGYRGPPASLPPDLEALSDNLVSDLSLGQQRRVAFTTALEHRPDLLILDEPTSGVDALSRSRLWDVIRARADAEAGVLVTTHFMDEARQCDRLVIMSEGRVVLEGTHDAVVGNHAVVQVDGRDWAEIFAALDRRGLRCGLVGRSVRVLSESTEPVRAALAAESIAAQVSTRPATLEETMVAIASGTGNESRSKDISPDAEE